MVDRERALSFDPVAEQYDDARRRLFDGIADLIENRYGGSVTRPYIATLFRAVRQ